MDAGYILTKHSFIRMQSRTYKTGRGSHAELSYLYPNSQRSLAYPDRFSRLLFCQFNFLSAKNKKLNKRLEEA